jgi:hypothetical protein
MPRIITIDPDYTMLDLTGVAISILGSCISVYGVITNNIFLDHVSAMFIWRWSNILLASYFFGDWIGWWNSRISSGIMFGLYLLFAITNEIGLGGWYVAP